MRNSTKRLAFTLAEVLITVGIIGIVAEMTIPTLVNDTRKQVEVTSLKKAYSEMTQALTMMATDAGCPDDLRCTGLFNGTGDWSTTTKTFGNKFKTYFKLSKDCGTVYNASDAKTKCFSTSVSQTYDGSYSNGNGTRFDMNSSYKGHYGFITADGFSISLIVYPSFNDGYRWKTGLNINQEYGNLIVDINNVAGPNNFGRDIFMFTITNGKGPALYPVGGSENYGNTWNGEPAVTDPPGMEEPAIDGLCDAKTPFGAYCTGRIMEQGWQMLY